MKTLKALIKEVLLENKNKSYYNITPNMKIDDIINSWVNDNAMLYDDDFHVHISPRELWPFREYTWSRDSAGGLEVVGKDSVSYTDKWKFIPDKHGNEGADKWDAFVRELQSRGWSESDPLIFEIGRNGVAKVGEGNHRLAIALELGLKVPVRFVFKHDVQLSHASNR